MNVNNSLKNLRGLKKMPRLWKERGGEENRDCDGRTALTEPWKEWKKNGNQEQIIEGIGQC